MIKQLFILFIFISFSVSIYSESIRIFYTSSLNGYIGDCLCKKEPMPGFTKRHTILKQLNYQKNSDILIDTGDFLEKKYNLDKVKAIIESYSLAGYHSLNLGLNEYYYGKKVIENYFMKRKFIHSGNVSIKSFFSNKSIGEDIVLLQRKGKKIAILSLASPAVLKKMNPALHSALSIEEPSSVISQKTSRIKADIWIINYYGTGIEAKKLADNFPNMIIIYGYEKKAPPKEGYSLSNKKNRVYHLEGEGEYLGKIILNTSNNRITEVEIIRPDFDKTQASEEILNIMKKYKVRE